MRDVHIEKIMGKSLGTAILEYRERKKLTQVALANKLGRKRGNVVSDIEHGEKKVTGQDLVRICKELEVPLLDVVDLAGDEPGPVPGPPPLRAAPVEHVVGEIQLQASWDDGQVVLWAAAPATVCAPPACGSKIATTSASNGEPRGGAEAGDGAGAAAHAARDRAAGIPARHAADERAAATAAIPTARPAFRSAPPHVARRRPRPPCSPRSPTRLRLFEVLSAVRSLRRFVLLLRDAVSQTHPYYPYLGAVEREIGRIAAVTDLPLVAYPNAGRSYDAVTKTWSGEMSSCTFAGATLDGVIAFGAELARARVPYFLAFNRRGHDILSTRASRIAEGGGPVKRAR